MFSDPRLSTSTFSSSGERPFISLRPTFDSPKFTRAESKSGHSFRNFDKRIGTGRGIRAARTGPPLGAHGRSEPE